MEHKWSCDNDCDIKKQIQHTFSSEMYFDDMFGRDLSKLPDIDLYVCGMPCQSFSIANNKRQGFEIKHGTLFFEAFEVIQYKRPKYFILENRYVSECIVSHFLGVVARLIIKCVM